jgi:hypothetical protein
MPHVEQDAILGRGRVADLAGSALLIAATDHHRPSRHIARQVPASLGRLLFHQLLDAGGAVVIHALAASMNLKL